MKIYEYAIKRFAASLLTLFFLALFVFSVSRIAGDPISAYVDPHMLSKETIDRIREQYHLNDPVYIQFLYWLRAALMGDFGISITFGNLPVTSVVIQYFPLTLELALFTIVITIPLTIILATLSVKYRDTWFDHALRVFAVSGRAMPSFFFALIVALFFYPPGWITFSPTFNFRAITGMPIFDSLIAGDIHGFVEAVKYLWGPLVVQVFMQLALSVRILRASMIEEVGKDYVIFAKSKGLGSDYVLKKYVRKNALSSFMTLTGLEIVWLLTGVTITETVFNRKGLGWFSARAAQALDYNSILVYSLITGIFLVVMNTLIDILYAKVDPRVILGE